MDLVKMLTSVEFSEVRRGLDRDEVAAFLQQVASAVSGLERRLSDALARAERAEARALELADDMSLRRTLQLAQRTADMAVSEADAEARRIVSEGEKRAADRIAEAEAHAERARSLADEEAATTVKSAQAKAGQILVEAKGEARRASDELRTRLRQEVLELEQARDILMRDVALFEAHMGEQRTRVQGALGALQMVLDHPDALRRMAIPPVTPMQIPASAIEEAREPGALEAAAQRAAASIPAPPAARAGALGASIQTASISSAPPVSVPALSVLPLPDNTPTHDPVIDLADSSPEIAFLDDDIDLRAGQTEALEDDGPATQEIPLLARREPAEKDPTRDEQLVASFFEQAGIPDERWKPARERRKG